jgi:hypothetical protein
MLITVNKAQGKRVKVKTLTDLITKIAIDKYPTRGLI